MTYFRYQKVMRYLIVAFTCLSALYLPGQNVENYEQPHQGPITLSDNLIISKINSGYTLWYPEKGQTEGLIVFTRSRRDTINSEAIIDHALSRNLAVLYATTSNSLDFFFEVDSMLEIEKYIQQAINITHAPAENLMLCGMSLEGTRALKLAIFAQSNQSKYRLKPRAVAICDAPLDMVRFHRVATQAAQLNFHPAAANEGAWVSAYLESNLKGSPADNLQGYVEYSPYCNEANGGPNLKYLSDVAVRAYTEPDVNWWIETRRKDYYAMNALDLAALINELKIIGNIEAELITTSNKGYHPNGNRHPHSWSIVDERELVDWFAALIHQ